MAKLPQSLTANLESTDRPVGRSQKKANGKQQHVVAVPMPSQGHLNSLMRFCKLLAQQEGFLVTFVDIGIVNNKAQEVSAGNANAAVADASTHHEPLIRRAHIPIDGLDLSNEFNIPFPSLFHGLSSIAPYLHQLILSLNRDGPPVTCLLSDFTITSPTQDVADQLGIPRIVLWPFCASWLLLLQYIVGQGEHVSMEGVREALAASATRKEVFCKGLSGLPTLFNIDLPQFRHVEDDSLFVWNHTQQWWKICNSRAHSIVINSFEELETSAFMALSNSSDVPVYGVGPWIETLHKECATSLWKEDEECITWLHQQPPSSVLYVSFGSITVLSRCQFEELQNGLLSSEQRFLWAFRPDLVVDGTSSSFPTHIMSKSHGKGFVVDWAPQLKVLSHPSVSGFLTHCGWNSVTESIAHGVPMLCWPYFADQLFNARCIVDEWKVGLDFEASDEIRSFIKSNEIERAIRSLMEGVKGELVRQNATKLKEACLECLSENGSSYKSIRALIGSLM